MTNPNTNTEINEKEEAELDKIITLRLVGIERHARVREPEISTIDTLWLIDALREKMAECLALRHAIESSANILGKTLEVFDVPEKLIEDLELGYGCC